MSTRAAVIRILAFIAFFAATWPLDVWRYAVACIAVYILITQPTNHRDQEYPPCTTTPEQPPP